MSSSSGKVFPNRGMNPGHIHFDQNLSPARAYMYRGGDPTDLSNSWTEVDLATDPNIFVKGESTDFLAAKRHEVVFDTNMSIDFSLAATQHVILTDNSTITLSNMVDSQVYRLILIQDNTGSRLITWANTIKWPGGSAPTLTTTGNKTDIVTILYSNSIIYADARLNF